MANLRTNLVRKSNTWSGVAKTLLIIALIGAINWGLIGFFNFNLVAAIFGENSALSRVIYAIVGLCGLASLFFLPALRVVSKQERVGAGVGRAERTERTTV